MSVMLSVGLLTVCLPQEPSRPMPIVAPPPAELVFVADAAPIPLAAYGLGDGGVRPADPTTRLQAAPGEAITPGQVQVLVLDQGVKLTFPSGRELLFAPDGHLHLRTGELAGPFPAGVELFLGDGTVLQIQRSGSRRDPITAVTVVALDERRLLWRRGNPVDEVARPGASTGARLLCCGDGGEVFVATSVTPLLVLARVLCPEARERSVPEVRVAVLTTPLLQSLQALPRENGHPVGGQREALRLAAQVAETGSRIFATDEVVRRVERKEPRYGLPGGFEIGLTVATDEAPRLQLFTGRELEPFVEWTLGFGSEARLLGAPTADAPVAVARGRVRVPEAVPALAPRRELREQDAAFRLLRSLAR
ncbi:MAG: hypothetical protein IPK26_22605 [Planctomycetes bacterium]|nr:hypothetical protein [Planctomycetota bacterium]